MACVCVCVCVCVPLHAHIHTHGMACVCVCACASARTRTHVYVLSVDFAASLKRKGVCRTTDGDKAKGTKSDQALRRNGKEGKRTGQETMEQFVIMCAHGTENDTVQKYDKKIIERQ